MNLTCVLVVASASLAWACGTTKPPSADADPFPSDADRDALPSDAADACARHLEEKTNESLERCADAVAAARDDRSKTFHGRVKRDVACWTSLEVAAVLKDACARATSALGSAGTLQFTECNEQTLRLSTEPTAGQDGAASFYYAGIETTANKRYSETCKFTDIEYMTFSIVQRPGQPPRTNDDAISKQVHDAVAAALAPIDDR